MAKDILLKVEGVSKRYCKDLKKSLWYGMKDLAQTSLGFSGTKELRDSEFWAVKDINFEVRRSECLGLIGQNGAGKSSLLKMLNGLITPDKGRIEMRGRVGALIELGAGFNPILTGRENIFNNAAVLGFSKKETLAKLDEIIEFSELENFLDTPVQNYSSGMKVRLGFAVAVQMKPDILLIDEVLAVGDMGFVIKCFNKMDQLLHDTAVVLVSHSMPQISRMSTHLLLMNKGEQRFFTNNVSSGITQYYEMFNNAIGDFKGDGRANILNIELVSGGMRSNGKEPFVVNYGDDLSIEIKIEFLEMVKLPWVYLAFYDKEQRNFAEVDNSLEFIKLDAVEGIVILKTTIRQLSFSQGTYSITIALGEGSSKESTRQTIFRYQSAVYFTVNGKHHGWAPIQFNPEWQCLK